jgi:hypothetical protein
LGKTSPSAPAKEQPNGLPVISQLSPAFLLPGYSKHQCIISSLWKGFAFKEKVVVKDLPGGKAGCPFPICSLSKKNMNKSGKQM